MKNGHEILLRIPYQLADELNQVSEDTSINKTNLLRMGLTRVLSDIKKSNIDNSLREISGYHIK